ncbi:MAG: protein-disulfide reductase DsbD N-terminal domain-containing protein [Pseudohongiellaceae bacterium]
MHRRSHTLVSLALCLLALSASAQPGGLPTLNEDRSRPVPLPLADAFPWYVSEAEPGQWQVTWNPAPGHYLYRHAFAFSLQHDDTADPRPVAFTLPPGLAKTDQFFGDIEAYYDQATATLALPAELPAGAALWIEYQGCADWGFCYPPQRQAFTLP